MPPWPGLAPWLSLISIIFTAGCAACSAKRCRIELPIVGTATEVAAAQLPDQVAATFQMVGADAALAGIVGEIAELGAPVERADRVRAERAEAHRRDVEYRSRIRLRRIAAHRW